MTEEKFAEIKEKLKKELDEKATMFLTPLYDAADEATKQYIIDQASLVFIREMLTDMYYAGHWTCDRPVNEKAYWEAIKDFCGLENGTSPKPVKEK